MGELILTALAVLWVGHSTVSGPSSSGTSTQGPTVSPPDSGATTTGAGSGSAGTTDGRQYPPTG
jgi:hypothetical protein